MSKVKVIANMSNGETFTINIEEQNFKKMSDDIFHENKPFMFEDNNGFHAYAANHVVSLHVKPN